MLSDEDRAAGWREEVPAQTPKFCTTCKAWKPRSEFYKTRARVDGLCARCKDCDRAHERNRRAKDPLHSKKRYAKRDPVKRKAREAVRHRIASGTIIRQPCERCGMQNAHAHHDDYSKPLEVRWLCVKHHAEVHRK